MTFSFDLEESLQGIALLEQKYQRFLGARAEHADAMRSIAEEAARVQKEMRSLIDGITAFHCPICTASCCQSLPVEGWFSETDYYLYRMLHDSPDRLMVSGGPALACRFLGPSGCVLPGDARPFPCVKVNCRALLEALRQNETEERFNRLAARLDVLQYRIRPLIK